MLGSNPCVISGEMTIHHAVALRDRLIGAIAEGASPFLLDLSEVTGIDIAGIQLLLAAQKSVLASNGTLQIVAASEPVAEVVEFLELGAQIAAMIASDAGERT